MIRILMADDHGIVREGIKGLFALTSDITVTQEAVNGGKVLEKLRQNEFDLLLLDMSMPGVSGVSLITRVRTHSPRLPILVLSMYNEPQIARRALGAGAVGYVTKDSEPEILLAAVRKVATGGRFIEPAMAEQLVFDVRDAEETELHENLSDREREILLLLAKGVSLNDIADSLAISNKTVSTHKMRLMRKMHISTNADLVRYAVNHSLVE